jgi:hypothetical protein
MGTEKLTSDTFVPQMTMDKPELLSVKIKLLSDIRASFLFCLRFPDCPLWAYRDLSEP